jgi:polyisoprenoid-binding protein YceI
MNTKHFLLAAAAVTTLSFTSCGPKGDAVAAGDAVAVDSVMADTTFQVDTVKTVLGWKGSKVTGDSHNGTMQVANGTLQIVKGDLAGGSFTINMNGMTNIDLTDAKANGNLLGHLKSEDFFDVAKFPTAGFEITKAEKMATADTAGNNYTITGNLTIKGVAKSITFPANVTITKDMATAMAKFTIDRTEWDIRYGSGKFFKSLGDKMINDLIEFDLNLSTTVVAAS